MRRLASRTFYGVGILTLLYNFLVYWRVGGFGQEGALSLTLFAYGVPHWWSVYFPKVLLSPVLFLAVILFLFSSDYEFVMRCWTPAELQSLLGLNGFGLVAYFGAYDPAVASGATDRLVAIAQRSSAA